MRARGRGWKPRPFESATTVVPAPVVVVAQGELLRRACREGRAPVDRAVAASVIAAAAFPATSAAEFLRQAVRLEAAFVPLPRLRPRRWYRRWRLPRGRHREHPRPPPWLPAGTGPLYRRELACRLSWPRARPAPASSHYPGTPTGCN